VVYDGHRGCVGYSAGQYGHVRTTYAIADSCTLHAALAIRQAATVTHADVPTVETVANRHVFRAAVVPVSRLGSMGL